jgi:hypothetical protein
MTGMYEIVGFDEIVVGGSYPPHSIQGAFGHRRRRHRHHAAGALPALIAGCRAVSTCTISLPVSTRRKVRAPI